LRRGTAASIGSGLAASIALLVLPHATARAAEPALSVLTYNVHGLPWPLALGRSAAFRQIEARLRALRRAGQQPHIVLLQEAFTADAKQIGRLSGYRYIADGPSRTGLGPAPLTAADRAFAAQASFWRGETSGKLVDSGLQILSDYPIVSVRHAAFPRFACAGFDCLANKGMLLATIAVPHLPRPLTIVTAHLNSRRASHASPARSFHAYQRQLGYMDWFLRASHDPRLPMIVAGDFNPAGAERRSYLLSHLAADGKSEAKHRVPEALDHCLGRANPCHGHLSDRDRRQLARGKDRQFYFSGTNSQIATEDVSVMFKRGDDGTMLSDHVGYSVRYGFSRVSAPIAMSSPLELRLRPTGRE
jgi:endonuclease/exonuclease/phosphatase family metal-dependent hydrolase